MENFDKYREEFIIPSYLTDRDRELSRQSVLSIFQELAYRGAEYIGLGDSVLKPLDLAWVLSRVRLVVHRAPYLEEKVRLETWSRGLDGPFFIRDWRILSADGDELVCGTGSFVILDVRSRAMKRFEQLADLFSPEPQCTDTALGGNAERIIVRGDDGVASGEARTVRYTDTDFVGHLNNVNYLKWLLDCEFAVAPERKPSDITINFMKETRLDGMLRFTRFERPDGIYYMAATPDGPVMSAKIN